jgi:hypothetical protein
MPGHLKVFGGCLHLPISADDLAIPALFGAVSRFLCILIAAGFLGGGLAERTCVVTPGDTAFLALDFVFSVVTFAMYYRLYLITSTGDIMHYKRRTQLTIPMFHYLTVSYVLELGLLVYGIILISTTKCVKTNATSVLFSVELVVVLAIITDFIALGVVLGLLYFFSRTPTSSPLHEGSYRKMIPRILNGISYLACGLFGTLKSNHYDDMAWTELSYLAHSLLKDLLLEFTIGDVVAATLLLREDQIAREQRRVNAKKVIEMSDVRIKSQSFPSGVPATDRDGIKAIKEFQEFAPYMIGMYGWKLQFYMSPLKCFCFFPFAACRRVSRERTNVELSVFKDTVGGFENKSKVIVYSSFTSYIGEAIPYVITVDHDRRAVVIAMR